MIINLKNFFFNTQSKPMNAAYQFEIMLFILQLLGMKFKIYSETDTLKFRSDTQHVINYFFQYKQAIQAYEVKPPYKLCFNINQIIFHFIYNISLDNFGPRIILIGYQKHIVKMWAWEYHKDLGAFWSHNRLYKNNMLLYFVFISSLRVFLLISFKYLILYYIDFLSDSFY